MHVVCAEAVVDCGNRGSSRGVGASAIYSLFLVGSGLIRQSREMCVALAILKLRPGARGGNDQANRFDLP